MKNYHKLDNVTPHTLETSFRLIRIVSTPAKTTINDSQITNIIPMTTMTYRTNNCEQQSVHMLVAFQHKILCARRFRSTELLILSSF